MACLLTSVHGPSTRAWRRARSTHLKSRVKVRASATGPQTTYSVLVDDIYNGHQLASMGSKRYVGNATDLDEAFEHLKNILKCLYESQQTTLKESSLRLNTDCLYYIKQYIHWL